MPHRPLLSRWDDLALEKVTEMIARKVIAGEREVLIQAYLKRGALVPLHAHPAEQMVYVLQGAILAVVDGAPFTVREGEVLRVPAGSAHQVEALDDTFVMTYGSPGSGLLGESQSRPLRQTPVP